jgi:uncharacterized protein
MRDKLRMQYHVQKEVSRKGSFEGEIALSELKRLNELLKPESSDWQSRKISFEFEFSRDELEIPMLVGKLETNLQLECQRCLKPIDWPLKLDVRLMIDASDEMVNDRSVDTIYSDGGQIDISAVVEDELILAIPLVAMHEDTACNENWQVSESETAVKENPFAVLQQLKTTD